MYLFMRNYRNDTFMSFEVFPALLIESPTQCCIYVCGLLDNHFARLPNSNV